MRTILIPLYATSFALGMGLLTLATAQPAQQAGIAPPLMLAQSYRQQSVNGWLASEKLDGVRAYWDGRHLYSRKGNIFDAPADFLAQLPPFPLDGELYLGRGRFQETLSRLRNKQWQDIRYHIFDVPQAGGGLNARLQTFTDWLEGQPQNQLRLIEQIPIRDIAHAEALRADIEDAGGEGLILRAPEALYLATRSEFMLKLKSHDDAECRVLAHLEGQGRHQGRLGALLCRLDDGRIIRIGSGFSDAQRQSPPPIGSRITFRFRGYTDKGLPRFATFWRIREE